MRVRRQARMLAQLVTEVFDLLLREAAFEKRPRVDAGRRMALKIDEIARLIAVGRVKEVVEADFEQRGNRRIGRDMAADAGVFFILAMYNRHGIPADQALDAPLQNAIAGVR